MFSKPVVAAAALALFSFSLTTAQVTSVSPSQSSKINADLFLYGSSIGGSPKFTSLLLEVATGVPSAQLSSIASASSAAAAAAPGGTSASIDLLSFATAPPAVTVPAYFSAFPANIASDLKSYATSVQNAEVSIVRSDLALTGVVTPLAAVTVTATGAAAAKSAGAVAAAPGLLKAAGLAAGAMGIAAAVL